MKKILTASIYCISLFASVAQANGFIGAQGGTLGPGLEAGATITDSLQFRVQAYQYDYDTSGVLDDIRYDIQVNMDHKGVLLDWQFNDAGWFFSGGLFANQLKGKAVAQPAGTYQIGNNIYTGAQVGQVITKVDTPDYAPYAEFGWNLKGLQESGINLRVSAGAFFNGEPDVEMMTSGPLFSNGAFQQDLERERQELKKELEVLKVIPALQLGLQYRF